MHPIVKIEDLNIAYHGKAVIEQMSFEIETGKLVGIIGPNGAGKSTLMKAMLALIPIDHGSIEVFGKNIREVRKNIAYVPQRSQIDWNFPITVNETVLLGTYPRLGIMRRPKKREKEWAQECLAQVGMSDYGRRQIGELSGGQQQRVFLARALAQKAELFLLDEPFVGIDIASEETIIQILKDQRDIGKTIIVVHHDLSKVKSYFDEVLLINKQLIGAGTVERAFTKELILQAYNQQLSLFKELGLGG